MLRNVTTNILRIYKQLQVTVTEIHDIIKKVMQFMWPWIHQINVFLKCFLPSSHFFYFCIMCTFTIYCSVMSVAGPWKNQINRILVLNIIVLTLNWSDKAFMIDDMPLKNKNFIRRVVLYLLSIIIGLLILFIYI